MKGELNEETFTCRGVKNHIDVSAVSQHHGGGRRDQGVERHCDATDLGRPRAEVRARDRTQAAFTFDNTRTVVKRVQDGETADVVVVPRQEIDSFVKNGKAVAGNVTAIASSGVSAWPFARAPLSPTSRRPKP